MDLGEFSISLTVKDLAASQVFYEKLGFRVVDGAAEQRWLILRNKQTVVGLFQGMFDQNILTFHPLDVRAVQRELKAAGLKLDTETDESGKGTTSILLKDPDGNPILMDQPMTPIERAAWDEQQRHNR
ncbi:MAG: VOC family protein [bacterium]|nr:VOC family protein [bacterium]